MQSIVFKSVAKPHLTYYLLLFTYYFPKIPYKINFEVRVKR